MSDGDYLLSEECCDSPELEFAIPRGKTTLRNDHRIGVSLPAGVISAEGLSLIEVAIREVGNTLYWNAAFEERDKKRTEAQKWWDLAVQIVELGEQWQTGEGNYTKRLSKLAYQKHGLKVDQSLLTRVGNTARTHSTGTDLRVEVTRNLNQPPSKFAHEGSCWWDGEEHGNSRCAAKSHGVFGLRSFKFRTVTGRAWVMALKEQETMEVRNLVPTFDTLNASAFMVFNGYGELDLLVAARVMGTLVGWPYRRANFYASPMYINANGILVAPQEVLNRHTGVELELEEHSHLYWAEQEARVS